MNFKYLPACISAYAKFPGMLKANSSMRKCSPQFFGTAFLILMQMMLTRPVAAQNVPNFTHNTGTVLSNTNGNWKTIQPQQPNNIGLVETNLYDMPPRGSGLMAVDFKLIGADGGTAQYLAYKANGGKGAEIAYTVALDSTAGQPFFVTFGKKGESGVSNGPLYCSAGGGGSTGMAWAVPGAQYCQLNFGGYFGADMYIEPNNPGYMVAAAGGGGGGFASVGGHIANGGGSF